MKHPARKSIGFQLRLAARLHRTRMAEMLHSIDLFPGQDQALQALEAGETTMGDLARALRIRPPTASKTIARLIHQGLVSRQTKPGDGRIVTIRLTEHGQSKLEYINAMTQALETEIALILEEKEVKRLRKSLRRITEGWQKASPNETEADDLTNDDMD